MTSQEHADRVARNTLELNQARRQLAAVRAYAATLDDDPLRIRRVFVRDVRSTLEAALTTQPPPTEAA